MPSSSGSEGQCDVLGRISHGRRKMFPRATRATAGPGTRSVPVNPGPRVIFTPAGGCGCRAKRLAAVRGGSPFVPSSPLFSDPPSGGLGGTTKVFWTLRAAFTPRSIVSINRVGVCFWRGHQKKFVREHALPAGRVRRRPPRGHQSTPSLPDRRAACRSVPPE